MANDADILNEIVRLLGSVPEKATFRHDIASNHEWLGAVLYVVGLSDDTSLTAEARTIVSGLQGPTIVTRDPRARLVILLQQLKKEYEFKVGYTVSRNYVELSEDQLAQIGPAKEEFKSAVCQDNEIDPDDRDILLLEIAIFEAQIGAARLSPDLIARFANGILKGAALSTAGAIVREAASRLADVLFKVIGWIGPA